MVAYQELVKKARELQKKVGQDAFRVLYHDEPMRLMHDLRPGTVRGHSELEAIGRDVLQAFPFHPLAPANQELHDRILAEHGSRVMLAAALGRPKDVTKALHILRERGLVKLAKIGKEGPLVVTDVFDGKVWRKAMLPENIRKSLSKAH